MVISTAMLNYQRVIKMMLPPKFSQPFERVAVFFSRRFWAPDSSSWTFFPWGLWLSHWSMRLVGSKIGSAGFFLFLDMSTDMWIFRRHPLILRLGSLLWSILGMQTDERQWNSWWQIWVASSPVGIVGVCKHQRDSQKSEQIHEHLAKNNHSSTF